MAIKTLAQDAAIEQLLTAIQHKEIFPGAKLFETDLEKSLGMSRTPIRAALDQLVLDGILEKRRNQRGYIFPKLSMSDLFEVYIFRERLEVTSVSLACMRWDPQAKKKIDYAINSEIEKSETQISDTYKDLSNGFHITLASISGNEYLISLLKRVYLRICMYELFYDAGKYRMHRDLYQHKDLNDLMIDQHKDIIRSIEQHDHIHAIEKILAHLRGTAIATEYVTQCPQWQEYERFVSSHDFYASR